MKIGAKRIHGELDSMGEVRLDGETVLRMGHPNTAIRKPPSEKFKTIWLTGDKNDSIYGKYYNIRMSLVTIWEVSIKMTGHIFMVNLRNDLAEIRGNIG